ncbi:hypothetical protein SK128_002842 [Halocaridina rubra]|uniref:Dynein heavy chain n=1 Tax=Halocaridina rubra TaxID=373956 RepID=A0AAN8XAM7_HALRR
MESVGVRGVTSIGLFPLFVGAMAPPSAGRNTICGRFTRHLNVLCIDAFDDGTLDRIFGAIVNWHFSTQEESTVQQLQRASSREVYKLVSSTFLPTPAKSHYVFNLRDFSRVISGILLVPNSALSSVEKLMRLWLHEIYRVFHDRLCDDNDRSEFFKIIKRVGEKNFRLRMETVLAHLVPEGEDLTPLHVNNLIFGDYMIPDAEEKVYDEIQDMSDLTQVVETYLHEYNVVSKSTMSLVLFQYMIQHVARISRVLKQNSGHALLIGFAGSGRQSCTKLAAYMASYDLFKIEVTKTYGVTEWRDDIKKVMMKAGGDGKPTVFLLLDTQIKDESFIEDVNTLLNTGDLPNLYTNEEKAEILEKIQAVAKDEFSSYNCSHRSDPGRRSQSV